MYYRIIQLLLPVVLIMALSMSCSDDDPPTGPANPTGLLVTAVSQAPVIDGTIDAVWSNAKSFDVVVGADVTHQNYFGQQTIMMKAVSHNNILYILARWDDPSGTESIMKKQWGYNGTSWTKSSQDEDRFFLMFDAGNNGTEGANCATMCHKPSSGMMATTGGGQVDVWHWKAARTNPGGALDDKWWDGAGRGSDAKNSSLYLDNVQIVNNVEMPKYMHTSGPSYTGKFLFVEDTVSFNASMNWTGMSLPFYCIDSSATGSRWEVKAKGVYSNGTWTLEMKRAFNTGNSDDVVLASGKVEVTIAITDNSGGDHSGSGTFDIIF